MGRQILAVLIGFVVWSVVWIAAQQILVAVVPDAFAADNSVSSTGVLLLFLVISVVDSLVSGWTTALLARAAPRRAAGLLAGLLLLVGLVFEIGGWGLAPAWYHIVFLLLLVPATLAGARLRTASGS